MNIRHNASQGRVPKALQAMERAVELAPQLDGARFQLGLLHFTSGNLSQAQQVWQPFENAHENHPLRCFSRGLLHLAADRFEQCAADLELGMAHCDSAASNKDKAKVIERAGAAASARPVTGSAEQHVMLSRYGEAPDSPTKH